MDIRTVQVTISYHDKKPCDYGDCGEPSPYIIWPDEIFPGNSYACEDHVNQLWNGRRGLGVHFSIADVALKIQADLDKQIKIIYGGNRD